MRRWNWLGLAVLAVLAFGVPSAFAQEAAGLSDEVKKWLGPAAVFGLALAALGGAIGQGWTASSAMTGISRNPGARKELFVPFLLGLVFIESLVLYTFVVAFFLYMKV